MAPQERMYYIVGWYCKPDQKPMAIEVLGHRGYLTNLFIKISMVLSCFLTMYIYIDRQTLPGNVIRGASFCNEYH